MVYPLLPWARTTKYYGVSATTSSHGAVWRAASKLEDSWRRKIASFVTVGILATSFLGCRGNSNVPTTTPSSTPGIRGLVSSSPVTPLGTSTTTNEVTPSPVNLGPGASGPACSLCSSAWPHSDTGWEPRTERSPTAPSRPSMRSRRQRISPATVSSDL